MKMKFAHNMVRCSSSKCLFTVHCIGSLTVGGFQEKRKRKYLDPVFNVAVDRVQTYIPNNA